MHSDDDDDKGKKGKSSSKAIKEFDCPGCEANNPTDDPIVDGSEIRCNYCGNEYLVKMSETGRLKFKEV
jgi:DNA-directed RNA polymerase subunit RPC12/RpoP